MRRSPREPDDMPRPAAIPQIDAPSSYVARIREHLERDEVQAARKPMMVWPESKKATGNE